VTPDAPFSVRVISQSRLLDCKQIPVFLMVVHTQDIDAKEGLDMRYLRLLMIVVVGCLVVSCATMTSSDPYAYTMMVFKRAEPIKPYFDSAYGYALFPTIGKGGLVVGGAYGRGQVYRQGVATGGSALVKMSIGWQIGGQAFSEIIFFEDQRAYDEFTSGGFEFDATASAVAVTAGAQAQIGTSGASAGATVGPATSVQAQATYLKGTAVFVHTKGGFMYEAVVGGQKFTFEPY
jgi:hypothetical protein